MRGRGCKRWKRLLTSLLLFPVLMGFMVEGEGTDGGAVTAAGDAGGGDGGGQEPTYEQLSTQAKELSDKAEGMRREKLSEEERTAEDTAKASEAVPEEYEAFTVPQDQPIDEALLNDFKPIAKELGLSQAKAQKLIDLYAEKAAPAMIQRQQEQWQGVMDGWKDACKTDKEIGGDKFDASLLSAQRVVNTMGTPELKELFNAYGIGNNPEVVRVFARMAQYLKEDSMEHNNNTRGANRDPGSALWPDLPKA